MAESLEMMKISPTTEDTIRNRFVEFLIYVLIEFNQYAYQIILVSADKKNAKSKEKYGIIFLTHAKKSNFAYCKISRNICFFFIENIFSLVSKVNEYSFGSKTQMKLRI